MKGSSDLLSFGFSTIRQAIVFSRKNTYLNVTGFHDTFIDKNSLNSVHTISSSSFLLSRHKPSTAWFSLKILKPPNNPFCPLHHFPKKSLMFMQKVHYKSVHFAQNGSQIPLRCEAYRKNQIGMLQLHNISRFYNRIS